MDRTKQMDLIRKRNSDLSKQLDDLKSKMDFDSKYNSESTKKAKSLIIELEQIRDEWTQALESLNQKRDEYDILIKDLKSMREIMRDPMKHSKKVPWYRKVFQRNKP